MRKIPLLDVLVQRYPDLGRESLLALVLCGDVRVRGEKLREPKRLVEHDAPIDLSRGLTGSLAASDGFLAGVPPLPWVSRGGDKLEGLFVVWNLDVRGKVILDAGSSTGGFSHCVLHHGARLVHAVDVGYNQLDWRLRQSPLVRVHEKTNIMGLEGLEPAPDLAVADLSFRTIAAPARRILELCREARLYALVKPQFERRYATDADFDGIVSLAEHEKILADLGRRLAQADIRVLRAMPCVIKGSHGNQEYFAEMVPGDGAANADLLAALAAPANDCP